MSIGRTCSLLLVVLLALTGSLPAGAQSSDQAEEIVGLEEIRLVGSRAAGRSAADSPVPVAGCSSVSRMSCSCIALSRGQNTQKHGLSFETAKKQRRRRPVPAKVIQWPLWPAAKRSAPNPVLHGALFAAVQDKGRIALRLRFQCRLEDRDRAV